MAGKDESIIKDLINRGVIIAVDKETEEVVFMKPGTYVSYPYEKNSWGFGRLDRIEDGIAYVKTNSQGVKPVALTSICNQEGGAR